MDNRNSAIVSSLFISIEVLLRCFNCKLTVSIHVLFLPFSLGKETVSSLVYSEISLHEKINSLTLKPPTCFLLQTLVFMFHFQLH